MAWLRDVFNEQGAISVGRLSRLGSERQLGLARIAFDLVGHDMAATAGLDPPSFEFADEEGSLRLAVRGHYSPSPLFGLTQSELSVEVADFVQEEVMEDLHQVWPECRKHRTGLHPSVTSNDAVWECRSDGGHVIAPIGSLSK